MRIKKRNRMKRMIIAYAMRALVLLVLIGMIFLMICGCLYLFEHLHKEETVGTAGVGNVTSHGTPQEPEQPQELNRDDTSQDSGITVVLDAGHGGNDGGTNFGDILEKDITLAVTEYMQELLKQQGVNVVMTREEDVYVGLQDRTAVSNGEDADMFVSIHCNSYEDDSSIKGMECYYYGDSKGKEYAEKIMESIKAGGKITARDAREEDYYVVRYTKAPAVLVELGFLSNYSERGQLTSADYQQLLAQELVQAIMQCVGEGQSL